MFKNTNNTKALLAGVSGTLLQWYDFSVFGYLAPIIALEFFPKENQFTALLSVFGVFTVGYLLAPLGAGVFGHIGDRYGRKKALTLSIFLMTIPTAAIAILPGFASIGLLAPLLLTLCRMFQGFVASAEYTGSAIFLVEHAKPGKQNFYGSLSSAAYSAGLILGALSVSFFTASFMPSWGWRLAFAVALIGGLLIFYLRYSVNETPLFTNIEPTEKARLPLARALKEMPSHLFVIFAMSWFISIIAFGTYVYMPTYLHLYSHLPLSQAIIIVTLALAVDATLEPFIARLADRIGGKPVILFGLTLLFLLSIPIFHLLASAHLAQVILGMLSLSIIIAITYAPLNAYMVQLFPPQYRYSGFGVAFNIGMSIFGGTTPLFLTWLVHTTQNPIAPAGYYLFGIVIAVFAMKFAPDEGVKSQFSI